MEARRDSPLGIVRITSSRHRAAHSRCRIRNGVWMLIGWEYAILAKSNIKSLIYIGVPDGI
jgi:hypothetical protein